MARGDSDEVGEEYSTSCPFCGDTRGRLYVNHLWGTKDKFTGVAFCG